MDQITSLTAAGSRAIEVEISNEELGTIGKETTICGDVEAKGHLAVYGCVNGGVKIKGNLLITGDVKGSIYCGNLILDGCDLFTSVKASGSVSIKAGAEITGNIECTNISVMGIVNGDIYAEGDVGLSASAYVKGNITCGQLAIEPGAEFDGKIKINKAQDQTKEV